jgi:hypothetical protein
MGRSGHEGVDVEFDKISVEGGSGISTPLTVTMQTMEVVGLGCGRP